MAGRYEVVRPIAQGGMATVFLAKVRGEGGFERLVALKVMHPHIANDPDFVSMFLDEARLAARIRHPNVVPTLSVERDDDGLCLVMEYIEGHPLHSILRTALGSRRLLPVPVALRIVVDLLEGLHAAHELRDEAGHTLDLVHRDVSPQNILVGADGVSRITDFGVAHARARLATTQGSALKGKIAYLAPEQLLSERKIDRRTDVFSAGIVLWEALTARRLFRGESEGETVTLIMSGVSRSPRDVRPDVPQAVADACMKALALDPAQRFQSAVEFADALEAAATLAKPREVAAEVVSLDVREAQVDTAKLPTGSGKLGSASGVSRGSASSAALPVVTPAGARPRPGKGRALVVAAVGVMLVAGIVIAVGMRPSKSTPAAAPLPPERPVVTATEAPSTPSAAAPKASAEALPTAAAPSAAAAPAPAPAKAKGAERAAPPPVRQPRPGSAGYRPEGL